MSVDTVVAQYRWIFVILAIWELVLKGLALWKSAQCKQRYWFIAILVINSVGILPIIYLLCCRYGCFSCCKSDGKKGKKK